MTEAALLRHLGPRLAHVTMRANLSGIADRGLLPAAEIARRTGTDPAGILLRAERLRLSGGGIAAILTHQRPILHNARAAKRVLDGHDATSWAACLDERVFFWPERAMGRFAASLARDGEIAVLRLDTARLLARAGDRVALSPINSGNFAQGGARARRGDWLFVPAARGLDAFRENRRRRGLVARPDRVREVSVAGALPADVVAAARTD